jgi:hypothetical protein
LSPLAQQSPGSLAIEGVVAVLNSSHVLNFTCCNVWFAFFRL